LPIIKCSEIIKYPLIAFLPGNIFYGLGVIIIGMVIVNYESFLRDKIQE
jgi:hypothetical protein